MCFSISQFTKFIGATFLVLIIGFSSCTKKRMEVPLPALIQAPIPSAKIPFFDFAFDAHQSQNLQYETGTEINIPANIFIDSLGKPYTGQVNLKYREFHDVVDILLSGIPMTYDSAGESGIFKSAGMFEWQAFDFKGQPLALDSGKSITVRLASMVEGTEYPLYYLDTTKRNWEYRTTPEVIKNDQKEEALQAISKQKPAIPFNPERTFVFDYFDFLDVAFDDYSKAFKNRYSKIMQQKFDAYGLNSVGFTSYSYFPTRPKSSYAGDYCCLYVWELDEKTVVDDLKKYRVKKYTMDITTALGGGWYTGEIKNRASKKVVKRFKAKRKISIKNLLKFSPEYYQKNYDKIMAAIEKVEQQPNVFRSFQVSQQGIFNCDYFWRQTDTVQIMAKVNWRFVLPEDSLEKALLSEKIAESKTLFWASGDRKAIVKNIFQADLDSFVVSATDTNAVLFAIGPLGSFHTFPRENYQKILDQVSSPNADQEKRLQEIDLTVTQDKAVTADEIRSIIGIGTSQRPSI